MNDQMWLFLNKTLFTKTERAHLAYELVTQSECHRDNKKLFCFIQCHILWPEQTNIKHEASNCLQHGRIDSGELHLPTFLGDNTTVVQKE